MAVAGDQRNISLGEITCGSLLQQLQEIWNEVGESDEQRDRLLLKLDQDCLGVYQRNVDQASKSRADLLQSLADSNIELGNLISALGESGDVGKPQNSCGTIKEQLAAISPALGHLRKLKEERMKEFTDVQSQIQTICREIVGISKEDEQEDTLMIDEHDLSLKKLSKFHTQLQELQREKSDRLHKVLDFVCTIHDLSAILGMDFVSTITEVHPSLNDSVGMESKSISNETLSKLARTVLALREDKKLRLQKLQESAAQLTELWNLMDTPMEERRLFDHVTCNISASVDEVTVPGALALDLLEQAEAEVERLDQLKSSKMKEIAAKKQAELEEIYTRAHIEIDSVAAREKIMAIIDSGNIEPYELIADMDNQILKAREEALSRKEILERVDKWMSTCEEESWLEDYNRDENRYSAGRGAHLNLKRAEKARVLVNKIPALVEALVAKTRAWEEDHGLTFVYDGAPLLAMLDEYVMLRQEREEEKRRMRDQKKFNEQLNAEQEALFGSRPSPSRPLGAKKAVAAASSAAHGAGSNGGGARSATRDGKRDGSRLSAPANYVAVAKEDAAASYISGDKPLPVTP
ncbi:unnamed protein product [Spirodela intermedia]|uniref:Uncharacterized protein n=1 Tax=Spirodela intermedia TaxID=51605 RepID=A0A7I8JQF5_SPIIN|nr:unnamed protein product [Spirodela intermedia]CAA6672366.1 unnamed protein product [Spirodela intermedia]